MKKDNIEKAKGIKTNELNTYLLKKYHCDTYTCLIRDNKKEHVFQPLELFHLAESVANYIVENKHTPPIHLQEYISKIATDKKFTAKQTYYYVSCLHDILTEKHSWQSCSTESLQTSSWQSDEIRYWLLHVISHYKEKAYPEKIKKEQIIVFSNLQKEAKEIQNSHERIKFWLEHIAEYKQFGRINLYQPEGNIKITFDKKCELEIEKEKEFAALETTPAQTETEQETPTFKNKFDNISTVDIYKHFKAGLVEKKYLTEQELNEYLKTAFELQTVPETLFKLKHTPAKQKVYTVFYTYYKDIAGKKHEQQSRYAELLGNYFEGYKTEIIKTNWARDYKVKR